MAANQNFHESRANVDQERVNALEQVFNFLMLSLEPLSCTGTITQSPSYIGILKTSESGILIRLI